jgi:hypothetical protein
MVGARALSGMLFLAGLALAALPVVLEPLLSELPEWLLLCLVVFFGLGLVRAAFNLVIGKQSTDHMVGILAADAVRLAFLAPFRALGWLVRMLFFR